MHNNVEKECSKVYKKIVCCDDFKAFSIIERLDPEIAKGVLMKMVLNRSSMLPEPK